MSLLAPLWLAGFAALLLPLALHLLARGRARRVRIGSVQLLEEAAARQPRRIALQRPLLLLVRCLLLTAVVLALAEPRREGAAAAASARAWLLVEPGLAGPLPAEATRPGPEGEPPEARWLAPRLPLVEGGPRGLERAGLGDAEAGLPDLAAVPGGLWSLLREASAAAPPGSELRVVTRGRLATLVGERPAVPQPVVWLTVPDPRPNRWLERVSRGASGDAAAGDALAALVARSDAAGTSFASVPLSLPAPGAAAGGTASAEAGGGPVLAGQVVRLPGGDVVPGDDSLPLPPPAATVRVALLAGPGREADARFLAAAARAAAAESGVRLELGTTAPAASSSPALAFWLGDAPAPTALLAAAEAGGTLVLDAGRPEERCGGSLQPLAAGPAVSLRRCAALPARATPAAAGATALAGWTSDLGRPLLLVEPAGRGRILRFAGRFHPAWSDLVLSPAFPAWLATLLQPEAASSPSAALPSSDRRADGGQGAPARGMGSVPRRPRPEPSRAPERALWAALPLLLLAERWLAGRRR